MTSPVALAGRLLRGGTPTAIGSLPHDDAAAAAAFALRLQPELPAAPQLPGRSPREGMVAQAAAGIRGVRVLADGTLTVRPHLLDPEAPPAGEPSAVESGGALAFLAATAAARRTEPVKLQLTGPVTLGLGLARAGAPADVAFRVAAGAVRARASALVAAARRRLPEAPLVVFLDEPGLTSWRHPGFPLEAEATTDLVSGALAALGPRVMTGVHCCGPTDWALPMAAGATVLSLPVGDGCVPEASRLGAFLDDGGWVAWGVVPTHGPIGDDVEPLWRRLVGVWCDLAREGCDPGRLRRQALVTPACGLAFHGLSQAERVLRLVRGVGERVQDQAVATRLSVGA